jgi:hypothetical protein
LAVGTAETALVHGLSLTESLLIRPARFRQEATEF